MKRKKQENDKGFMLRRGILIGLCVFLALILILLIIGVGYVESLMGLMNNPTDNTGSTLSPEQIEELLNNQTKDPDSTFTGPTMNAEDVTWAEDTTPVDIGTGVVNILLIGQDQRPGEYGARSDTMILCTLNKGKKTVTLTSFMRDMYVQIPGYSDNRINASYQLGGAKLLNKTLEKNFGVQTDGNIEVDFNGFVTVLDMLGGIEMELTEAEARYLNRRGNWDFEDDTAGTWSLVEGVNHLTGSQAMAYARIRAIGNADFERTERQRKLLTALAEKAKGMSLMEFDSLLRTALPYVTTDMSNAQIFDLALTAFSVIKDLQINTQRIPADGTFSMVDINEMEVLLPNLQANRELLASCMKE